VLEIYEDMTQQEKYKKRTRRTRREDATRWRPQTIQKNLIIYTSISRAVNHKQKQRVRWHCIYGSRLASNPDTRHITITHAIYFVFNVFIKGVARRYISGERPQATNRAIGKKVTDIRNRQ